MTDATIIAERSAADMIGSSFEGERKEHISTDTVLDDSAEKFDFDADFQTRVAALSARSIDFVNRVGHLLKPEYFEDVGEATIVNLALKYFERNRSLPDKTIMADILKRSVAARIVRKDVVPLAVAGYKRLYGSEDLSGREYIEERVVEFARHQATSAAILKSVELVQRGEFDKVEKYIKEAVEIGINEDGGAYDYYSNISIRTSDRLDDASGSRPPRGITTGHFKLDEILYHRGWGRKELAIIMGGAKAGKCVTRDTLIFTEDGLSEIGRYVPRTLAAGSFASHEMTILGMNGPESTSHIYNSGVTPTIRIKTAYGLQIEGTHHHPMLVVDDDGYHVWKNLDEIKMGDFIVGQRGERFYGSKTDLQYAVDAAQKRVEASKRQDAMNAPMLPTEMTPDLAEWLAMIVAEGTTGKCGSISFTQKDEEILGRFVALTESLFGLRSSIIRASDKVPTAQFCNVTLQAYLEALGVDWGVSCAKVVPHAVLAAPRDSVLKFLSAAIGLEGCVRAITPAKTVFDLTMASKTLIRQVQMLLMNEGVLSRYSQRTSRATNGLGVVRDYYRLQVSGGRNIEALKGVGLYERRKNEVLNRAICDDRTARDWLPNQRGLVGQIMVDFQSCGKPLKSTLDADVGRQLRTLRSGRKGERRHLTFAFAEKLLALIDKHEVVGGGVDRLREVVGGRFFYAEVRALESGEAETVDLTVPGTHSFFANGLVSHNTTALIGFAKAASQAKFNVLYVTLEVSARIISDRLDAAISDTMMKELSRHIKDIEAKVSAMESRSGRLIIHEYPTGTFTPKQLRALLDRYESKGQAFDLVVVDYGDIMAPSLRTNDALENSKSIFIDLRAIAQEKNVAMLTATQTNRAGFTATVAKAEHVAEDFSKIRTADLVISINITDEERSRGEARLYFAASRNSESGFTLFIKQNVAKMQFIESILRKE
jgi:intein/homing endonuclease